MNPAAFSEKFVLEKTKLNKGGSPSLVVMGRDSCSKVRGFESQHRILDGQFSKCFFSKKCNDVCLKRPKITEKEAGIVPL